MAAVSTVVAAAALTATAVSAYQQYQSAQDAADAQEEYQAISGAQQQIERRRQTRQQMRQERIRRAQILQASENTGVSGSSSQFGSTAALGTLTGSNIAAGRGQARAAAGMSAARQRGQDAATEGQMWGGIGQLSGSIFSAAGGFGAFQSPGSAPSSPVNGGFRKEVFTIDQGSSIFRG